MSGRDLFEGMSYVDERFVDEAESRTLPKRTVSPWLKVASLAACLCLVIFSLYNLNLHQNLGVTEGATGDVVADAMPEGGVEPEDHPAASAPEMILRITGLTDTGFIGTVAEPGSFVVFEFGTEITVIVDVETVECYSPDDYRVGDLVHLMYTSWDEEEKTVVASVLGVVEEPVYD